MSSTSDGRQRALGRQGRAGGRLTAELASIDQAWLSCASVMRCTCSSASAAAGRAGQGRASSGRENAH